MLFVITKADFVQALIRKPAWRGTRYRLRHPGGGDGGGSPRGHPPYRVCFLWGGGAAQIGKVADLDRAIREARYHIQLTTHRLNVAAQRGDVHIGALLDLGDGRLLYMQHLGRNRSAPSPQPSPTRGEGARESVA